jgi:transcriptional regulator with XRE-family HTH domain
MYDVLREETGDKNCKIVYNYTISGVLQHESKSACYTESRLPNQMDSVGMRTLSDFIKAQLTCEDISASELARRAGLSTQTVVDLLHPSSTGDKPEYPSLRTLLKLARATRTDLGSLVALAVSGELTDDERQELLIGLSIRDLPPYARRAISALIETFKEDIQDEQADEP